MRVLLVAGEIFHNAYAHAARSWPASSNAPPHVYTVWLRAAYLGLALYNARIVACHGCAFSHRHAALLRACLPAGSSTAVCHFICQSRYLPLARCVLRRSLLSPAAASANRTEDVEQRDSTSALHARAASASDAAGCTSRCWHLPLFSFFTLSSRAARALVDAHHARLPTMDQEDGA